MTVLISARASSDCVGSPRPALLLALTSLMICGTFTAAAFACSSERFARHTNGSADNDEDGERFAQRKGPAGHIAKVAVDEERLLHSRSAATRQGK